MSRRGCPSRRDDVLADRVGVVAFSFGLRGAELEPGPCNVRLAEAAARACSTAAADPVVVAQWEIAEALGALDVRPSLVVRPRGSAYLGSAEVWSQAAAHLAELRVRVVVPIAHPFLHLHRVTSLITADGFTVRRVRIGRVGFDRSNPQWWTRSPAGLVLYAVRQAMTGRGG